MKINIITPLSRPENLKAMYVNLLEAAMKGITIHWYLIVDASITGTIIQPPGFWLTTFRRIATYLKASELRVTVLNGQHGAMAGHAHRNMALPFMKNWPDWIMSLDDDNVMHPSLPEWLIANEEELELKYSGLIFDQLNKDGSYRLKADPDKISVNHVDTAQYMFRGSIVGDLRFQEDAYNADGIFIEELYRRHRDQFLIVNQPLCYYNYLRP
jgi:hypothetical protein